MRIAMIAPLIESVPPTLYGGTERVVSVLTEELVARGHDVTLFASGDSRTSATLHPCCERSLRQSDQLTDAVACALIEMAEVYDHEDGFDLIHNHNDYLAFGYARHAATPTVTTAHGRLDLPEVQRTYGYYAEQHLVSISHDQRTWLPNANWAGTVYNAIDLDAYHFQPDPGDYLVFLGRICPEKRPDRAIDIARDVGMRLIIAAKVDPVDRSYYEQAIAPVIRHCPDLIEYVGEVDGHEKDALLGGAYACLFPIDWPEPFGLTMAESMATGTPVIATRVGSVPEVIEDGTTGFVCNGLAGMIESVRRVGELDRRACRARVEALFSPAAMADGYEGVYDAILHADLSAVRSA
jgi:glycosyltransferase involved in cell wall biosynthesis